jgi:hypothetical protein
MSAQHLGIGSQRGQANTTQVLANSLIGREIKEAELRDEMR